MRGAERQGALMNTLSESVRPAAGVDPTDVAVLRAVADMRPGWVVLRDCLLADDGRGTQAPVRYALLHPEIGIALLDVLPGATTPGAPHRMRRMLDATSFRLAFGDYPPHRVPLCPVAQAFRDRTAVGTEFRIAAAGRAGGGGDAWVAAVQQAFAMTEQPPRVSGKVADGRRSVSIESPRSPST